jgi:hypothetical protein
MFTSPRSRSATRALAALVVAVALLGSACGGSDSSDESGGDERPEALTGTAPTTTERSTTTTTEATSSPDEATIAGAVIFVDPDGRYTIEVSPDWPDATGTDVVPEGIELFYVGTGTDEFKDNINILEQPVGTMSLQDYLDRSIEGMGSDLEVIDSGIATGAYGQELGYIEYAGMVPTAPIPVHAFATFAIADGQVVLATLTTTEATAAEAEDTIAEYLTTLVATSGGATSGA